MAIIEFAEGAKRRHSCSKPLIGAATVGRKGDCGENGYTASPRIDATGRLETLAPGRLGRLAVERSARSKLGNSGSFLFGLVAAGNVEHLTHDPFHPTDVSRLPANLP